MGANWNEGMMRWAPFVDAEGKSFSLNHLHPFRYELEITDGQTVEIRVAFAMHCFTRGREANSHASQLYKDEREVRTFCHERYVLSAGLPLIARELATRRCGFAKHENYVTIDVQTSTGKTGSYGVFFNVLRVKDAGGPAVLLTVQSAYELHAGKQPPIRGSIKFTRLIELTLEGTKPRPPRN
jgi:hypothetical protein